MSGPLVSCICLTYGRPPEKRDVEAFLRQDYALRELIVLNDSPLQTLSFVSRHHDLGKVLVINAQARYASLG